MTGYVHNMMYLIKLHVI